MKRKRIDLTQLVNDIIFDDDEKENQNIVSHNNKKRRFSNNRVRIDSNNNSPVYVFQEIFAFNDSKRESIVGKLNI